MRNACLPTSWSVWPLWALTTIVGNGLAGTGFVFLYSYDAFNAAERSEDIGLVLGIAPIVGLAAPCILQWLILRRFFANANLWIPASGLGGLLALLPFLGIWAFAASETQSPIGVPVNVAFLLAGATAGAIEWFVLRRWVSHAGWWVLTRSVASLTATWLFILTTMTGEADPSRDVHVVWFGLFLNGAMSGAVSGGVSGFVLVWLLRQSRIDQ